MKELSTIELKADNKLQNREVKNTSKYRQVKRNVIKFTDCETLAHHQQLILVNWTNVQGSTLKGHVRLEMLKPSIRSNLKRTINNPRRHSCRRTLRHAASQRVPSNPRFRC